MSFPLGYITKILKFQSIEDLIENLYLSSIIDASLHVKNILNIQDLDENRIRNEFQKIICTESYKLSDFINRGYIKLCVENQIILFENQVKRTDIEFFIPKFEYIIECKKLSSVSKTSYIDNGLLRFTSNSYINENQIYGGMCSFVFSDNITKLITGIKKRVTNHNLRETIDTKIICDFPNSFYSKHNKCDNKELTMHHLFFDFNQ